MRCFSVGDGDLHFPQTHSLRLRVPLIVLICQCWEFAGDLQESPCTCENLKKRAQSSKAFRSLSSGDWLWGLQETSIFLWPQQDPSGLWQLPGLAGQPHLSQLPGLGLN